MNNDSYEAYANESDSWLHLGRKYLLSKIMQRFITPDKKIEILEIGAGVGQNVDVLMQFGNVDVLEINPIGLELLHVNKNIRNVIDKKIPTKLPRKYDLIVACDVIEHIKDDKRVVNWISKNLKNDGYFISTVPAFQFLFSDHDKALGHYRRYTKKSFDLLLPKNLTKIYGTYFNFILFPIAMIARFFYQVKRNLLKSKVLNKQTIPKNMSLNSALLFIMKTEAFILKRMVFPLFGLSYFLISKKNKAI